MVSFATFVYSLLTNREFWEILGLIIIPTIVYFVGKHIGKLEFKKNIDKVLKRGTGRLGIITSKSYSNYGNSFIIEIEELETAGELTKVRVIDVVENHGENKGIEKNLKDINFKEWVNTKLIIWYDSNTQRIRDEKLNEILNK